MIARRAKSGTLVASRSALLAFLALLLFAGGFFDSIARASAVLHLGDGRVVHSHAFSHSGEQHDHVYRDPVPARYAPSEHHVDPADLALRGHANAPQSVVSVPHGGMHGVLGTVSSSGEFGPYEVHEHNHKDCGFNHCVPAILGDQPVVVVEFELRRCRFSEINLRSDGCSTSLFRPPILPQG